MAILAADDRASRLYAAEWEGLLMNGSLFRKSLVAPLFACTVFAAGLAAEEYFISYRYDGDYVGATEVSPDISSASCAPLPLAHVEIRNGILRAYDQNGRQTVKGFVTGDGFFTSDYYFADGSATLFEGLVDREGEFTGGIVDGACAWVVKLRAQSLGM